MDVFNLAAKLSLDSSEYENGLSGVMSGIGNTAKKLSKAIGGAVAGGTAVVAGFSKKAVETGAEFDKAMSQVVATMGFSISELDKEGSEAANTLETLRNFALEMGSATVFSATQAAEALNYMALAGYDAETSMKMLPVVLNLAAAGGMELATASDMITDAQTALGLSLDDTVVMVDQMAKTASTTNTSVAQLGEAILTIGGTAQYMAGGTEELNSVLGVLANNGIKGSEAGTHLRNMLLSLSAPTKDATDKMKELGLEVFDQDGQIKDFASLFGDLNKAVEGFSDQKKLDVFSALFNTRDTAAATALLNTTQEQWADIKGGILDSKSAAESMASVQLSNLAGDITLLKSAFEGLQIVISDSLTPTIREFVQFASQGISSITSAFKQGGIDQMMETAGDLLSEGVEKVVEKLPSMTEAGVKLVIAFAKGIISNLPQILTALGEVSEIVGDGVKELITEAVPILINNFPTIIKTLLTVVRAKGKMLRQAGLTLLTAIADGIKDNLSDIAEWGKEIITNLVEEAKTQIPLLLEMGKTIIDSIVQVVTDNLPLILEKGSEILSMVISGITDNISSLMEMASGLVTTILDVITENLPTLLGMGLEMLGNIIQGITDAIPQVLETGSEILTTLVNVITENLPTILQSGIEILTAVISGITEAIPTLIEMLPTVIDAIVTFVTDNLPMILESGVEILTSIISGITEAIPALVDMLPDVIDAILTFVTDNLPMILKSGIEILMSIISGIAETIPALVEILPDVIDAILTFVTDNLPLILEMGVEILKAVISGIVQAIPSLVEKLPEIITSIVNFLIDNIPLIIEAGIQLFVALVEALPEIIDSIVEAIPKIITAIVDSLKEKWPEIKENGKKLIQQMIDAFATMHEKVKESISKIGTKIKDAFKETIDKAKTWGKDLIDNFVGGIKDKVDKVKDTVSNVASTIKGFLGFSEPEKGPLSNFHTYAPDMMDLFAKGIYDNENVVTDAIEDAFNFGTVGTIEGASGGVVSASNSLVAAIQEALDGYTIKWDDRNLGRLVKKYA